MIQFFSNNWVMKLPINDVKSLWCMKMRQIDENWHWEETEMKIDIGRKQKKYGRQTSCQKANTMNWTTWTENNFQFTSVLYRVSGGGIFNLAFHSCELNKGKKKKKRKWFIINATTAKEMFDWTNEIIQTHDTCFFFWLIQPNSINQMEVLREQKSSLDIYCLQSSCNKNIYCLPLIGEIILPFPIKEKVLTILPLPQHFSNGS